MNRLTGEITGIPTGNDSHVNCIIYGKNQVGRIATTLEFVVKRGRCEEDGYWPTTYAGEEVIYECSTGGSYYGTQKRVCILGSTGGVWQSIEGTCKPIVWTVLLVIVVILLIVIVVLVIIYFICNRSFGYNLFHKTWKRQ